MTGQPNQHLLIFQVGHWRFGVRMPFVKQVQTVDASWVATDPHGDTGTLMVEDDTLPLYRLHRLLGTPPLAADNRGSKILVFNHRDQIFGLLADRIEGVIAADPRHISPLSPAFGDTALACFAEVFNQNGDPVLMIQPEGLTSQWDRLIETHVGDDSPGSRHARPSSSVVGDDTDAAKAAAENDATEVQPHRSQSEPEVGNHPSSLENDVLQADPNAEIDASHPPAVNTADTDTALKPICPDVIEEDRLEKILCQAIETITQQKLERLFSRAFLLTQMQL